MKPKFITFTVRILFFYFLPAEDFQKGENVKEYVMKFYPNFIAEPVATDLNTYVVNDISSFTKKDQNHPLQINVGNNENDKLTAIVRGTTQIWKPYSPSYIGSLYF